MPDAYRRRLMHHPAEPGGSQLMPDLPHLPKTHGSLSRTQRVHADAFLSGSSQDDADPRKESMIFREKHVQEREKTPRGLLQEKHLKEKESQKYWQLSEVLEIQEALEEASREEGELLEALCRVRKTVEAFLTDRAELLEQRISMVLALCHDVQNQIGKYETEKIEEVCEKFENGRERLKKQITEDMAGVRWETCTEKPGRSFKQDICSFLMHGSR